RIEAEFYAAARAEHRIDGLSFGEVGELTVGLVGSLHTGAAKDSHAAADRRVQFRARLTAIRVNAEIVIDRVGVAPEGRSRAAAGQLEIALGEVIADLAAEVAIEVL